MTPEPEAPAPSISANRKHRPIDLTMAKDGSYGFATRLGSSKKYTLYIEQQQDGSLEWQIFKEQKKWFSTWRTGITDTWTTAIKQALAAIAATE